MVRQNYDMTCFCKSWEGESENEELDEKNTTRLPIELFKTIHNFLIRV